MSLLEDVFLQDEAGEAQELERIIEGDEYEERVHDDSDSNENSEKEDEAEEDKRRVDPSSTKAKRVVKNPRFVLNPARLTGPRGIQVIPDHFKDFKFKGKGHEKEDLDLVLKKLEHWAYRLYPKFKFEDCLKKIETLGKKRPVMVHLHKIRSDQFTSDDQETVVQKDSSDDEAPAPPEEDEFDQLLQQQIDLARATPGPGDKRQGFNTPATDKRSSLMKPKATSSPSISDEQKERMMRNRKLAEERRLARLKATAATDNSNAGLVDLTDVGNSNTAVTENSNAGLVDLTDVGNSNTVILPDYIINDSNGTGENKAKKHRTNVIDSSDDDCDEINFQTVAIDVHKTGTQNSETPAVNLHKTGNQNPTDFTEKTHNSIDLTETLEIDAHKDRTQGFIDFTDIGAKDVHRTGTQNSIDLTETVALDAHKASTLSSIDLTEGTAQKGNITNSNVVDLDMEIERNENKQRNVVDVDSDDDNLVINETSPQVSDNEHDLSEVKNGSKTGENEKAIESDAVVNIDEQINDTDDLEDECSVTTMHQSIVVDVHKTVNSKKIPSDKTFVNVDRDEHKDADEIMIATETLDRLREGSDSIKIVGNDGDNDASKKNDEPLDKENIDANTNCKGDVVLDDLMDADFSDDF